MTEPVNSTTSATDKTLDDVVSQLENLNETVDKIESGVNGAAESGGDIGDAVQGMKHLQMGQFIGAAAAATIKTIGALVCMKYQKKAIEHQKKAMRAQYEGQRALAEIDKETKSYALGKKEELIKYTVASQKKSLAADRDLRRAEGQLAIAEATVKEEKLTDEVGKVDKDFDSYFNGNPHTYA